MVSGGHYFGALCFIHETQVIGVEKCVFNNTLGDSVLQLRIAQIVFRARRPVGMLTEYLSKQERLVLKNY
jgi:hypothetical protein